MSQLITAIDLGSNSFRVLKYDFRHNTIVNDFHEVVGMADGLVQTGQISNEAQQRVIAAIQKSSKELDFKPSEAICVTTAAMRYASNNQEVLENFKETTGACFEIIEPKEEARLTLLAIQYALKREHLKSEKFMVLDIGGGSTEIIVCNKKEFFAKSFPFGIVTLTQAHASLDEINKVLQTKQNEVSAYLTELNIDLSDYLFISTAGTPTSIAAVKLGLDAYAYDKELVNGTVVNQKDLNDALEMFKNRPFEELSKLVGKGRVEFIEVGILIFQMIFKAVQKNETIVFDDGLREGVAINHFLRE